MVNNHRDEFPQKAKDVNIAAFADGCISPPLASAVFVLWNGKVSAEWWGLVFVCADAAPCGWWVAS